MDNRVMEDFLKRFESEEACSELLFAMKWPEGFRCSRCSCTAAYRICTRRLPLYECRACHVQHSLTVGTVMEGSRTPLSKWFASIYWFATAKDSISALRLSSIIEVTYKTAWLILHKIRDALQQGTTTYNELLRGIVRVQGGAYGSPFNPYTESDPQRHPLLAGGSVNASGEVTALRLKIVEPQHVENGYITWVGEQAFIRNAVSPQAMSVTSLRFRMHRSRFRPLVRCIAAFGRWVSDVFHGLGRKYLQCYANEFSFRFNLIGNNPNPLTAIFQLCTSVSLPLTLRTLSEQYSSQSYRQLITHHRNCA